MATLRFRFIHSERQRQRFHPASVCFCVCEGMSFFSYFRLKIISHLPTLLSMVDVISDFRWCHRCVPWFPNAVFPPTPNPASPIIVSLPHTPHKCVNQLCPCAGVRQGRRARRKTSCLKFISGICLVSNILGHETAARYREKLSSTLCRSHTTNRWCHCRCSPLHSWWKTPAVTSGFRCGQKCKFHLIHSGAEAVFCGLFRICPFRKSDDHTDCLCVLHHDCSGLLLTSMLLTRWRFFILFSPDSTNSDSAKSKVTPPCTARGHSGCSCTAHTHGS